MKNEGDKIKAKYPYFHTPPFFGRNKFLPKNKKNI